jgi:hypothetical protein
MEKRGREEEGYPGPEVLRRQGLLHWRTIRHVADSGEILRAEEEQELRLRETWRSDR